MMKAHENNLKKSILRMLKALYTFKSNKSQPRTTSWNFFLIEWGGSNCDNTNCNYLMELRLTILIFRNILKKRLLSNLYCLHLSN